MTWKKDQKVDFLRFEVGENDLSSFSAQSLKALLSKMIKMIFLTHYVLIQQKAFYNGLTTTACTTAENFNCVFLPLQMLPITLSACGAGNRLPPLVGLPLSPPVFQPAVLQPNSKTWRVLHHTWQTDCQSLVWTPLQKSSLCDHENWQVWCLKCVKRDA